jgi:hypothetical protein
MSLRSFTKRSRSAWTTGQTAEELLPMLRQTWPGDGSHRANVVHAAMNYPTPCDCRHTRDIHETEILISFHCITGQRTNQGRERTIMLSAIFYFIESIDNALWDFAEVIVTGSDA